MPNDIDYRVLFEYAAEAMIVADAAGHVLDANRAATALFGASVDTLRTHRIHDFVHDPNVADDRWRVLVAVGEQRGTMEIRTADRRQRVVHYVTARVSEDRLLSIVRDVTAETRASIEFDQAAAIVSSSEDAIFSYSLAGVLVTWNAGSERLCGHSAPQAIGQPVHLILPPESRPEFDRMVGRVRLGQSCRGRFQLRHRDGTRLDASVAMSPLRSATGELTGASVIARDVTDSVRHERELRASEAMLARAQAVAHVGSWVREIDPPGPLRWSEEAHRIFGGKSFDGSYETYQRLIHPDDRARIRAAAARAYGGVAPFDEEYRIVRADGTVRWVRAQAELVIDAGGRKQMIGTIQDLTERRALEDQFRQAQKMEAVGRLAGGIAHDFNNLLTAVLGFSDLAAERLPDGHPARKDIEEIRNAGASAAALTRQLLAFSRKQILQPQVIDLNEVLRRMGGMLERVIGEDVALRRELSPVTCPVLADPGQIEQVVANLAVNARDALPSGGTITIHTARVRLDPGFVASHPGTVAGPHAMLSVSDSGIGMPPETLERLFEPFFTTKPSGKGTGLGLATVYGIVKQSGGSIWVQSEEGRGTTFTIYLPLVERPVIAPAAELPLKDLRGTERILVVEDQAAVRDIAVALLERYGYRVTPAAEPADALRRLEEGQPFDLLLTDVVMPGTNGVALAAAARAMRPDLRVLFMSGYTDDALLKHEGLQPGALLHKPFTPRTLLTRVREALDAKA